MEHCARVTGDLYLSLRLIFNFEFLIKRSDLGGYSVGVPPLPIPNREVKPNYADGTALVVGE